MNSPYFSIIIPHNNTSIEGDSLLTTLASVADQEGVSVELVLQHGGNIPGLWGKLSRILNLSTKKETFTLRVIEEKSSSTAEALVSGLRRATGTWIGFLQPGEQYLLGTLRTLQESFEAHPEVDIFLTASVALPSNEPVVTPAIIPTLQYLMSVQPSWPAHSFFCRTSLLRENMKLEPNYQHQMITEWLLRLLYAEKKIKTLPIVTAFTTDEENQKETLLPKATGITSWFKSWWEWRHQAAIRQAQKAIKLPYPISIYQRGHHQRGQ